MEENEQNLEIIMGLIANAGNAKSFAFEAIAAAKQNDFELADSKLKEANNALIKAHDSQTKMLSDEASGKHSKLTLLSVHSQDHLMTSITFLDLAREIIDLYKIVLRKTSEVGKLQKDI
ncbi:PTS lactose/cellobiose transporter subunit IIA [Oenococcus oeni]|uniref:PTS lactose/cellobiose transporter subunit IIA n=1 Tax=Oenococcus oeni TaxID=1247 RepID=UPI00067D1767|nr:PTS lactose/cellobiose transporter subunit IIA [Oenococcus oeni]OIK85873.1 PTS lactose/cellobiose transporter subunit IIA [Oenococcus oeni]OIL08271.1 PTS lactose/cellobiose transporter subunit IIA [Oenococcus oeni]OIL12279.1 PTS lactose/cellobiose transporter subunit IIA [Oenococcus oeni]OIL68692.1 PTS lactose/cellobiose transporter subunit IIA [Oenococcus oeni]OIM08159.1 PTS lactose/cellobiose transporter subunit IIA [Oenococcus oeni]